MRTSVELNTIWRQTKQYHLQYHKVWLEIMGIYGALHAHLEATQDVNKLRTLEAWIAPLKEEEIAIKNRGTYLDQISYYPHSG